MVFIELARRFIVHFMIFEFSFLCCAFPVSDFFFARSIGIGYSDSRISIRSVWISSGWYDKRVRVTGKARVMGFHR